MNELLNVLEELEMVHLADYLEARLSVCSADAAECSNTVYNSLTSSLSKMLRK